MDNQKPSLTFSQFSEINHGRFAMIGFAIIAHDLLTGNGLLHYWGLM
ncbi:MAG: high light inducible protein [Leptolyngbyaceae cyanobacterium MO_188.B28]|nr:high light inducible protein [Leptolyngbyaceae cyanobacterium MO_188.B28]